MTCGLHFKFFFTLVEGRRGKHDFNRYEKDKIDCLEKDYGIRRSPFPIKWLILSFLTSIQSR